MRIPDGQAQQQPDTTPQAGEGLSRFAPYLINRIARRYNQSVQESVTSMGLTIPKMRVLAALATMGKLTVNELTVVAVAEQSTMSRTLDQMERDALIQRLVSENDSRVRVVVITPAGLTAYHKVWPQMTAAEDALFVGLSPQQREDFLSTLLQILQNIRQNDV
ncbi:MarR family winged helix-turn-helix transcriptional regulator [uncultured Sulfitobacter sp.]|uniref:MarR family winged helix-turn-helix transcriptional regulator n=1 Tax=uncultured Sulfitobacter sp. TaxID=191468 RepID=UPI002613B3A8|nr:MarR family winged helix-turn-helix transcriptional regulator [uncultured Sulfitobacter sp.]